MGYKVEWNELNRQPTLVFLQRLETCHSLVAMAWTCK